MLANKRQRNLLRDYKDFRLDRYKSNFLVSIILNASLPKYDYSLNSLTCNNFPCFLAILLYRGQSAIRLHSI